MLVDSHCHLNLNKSSNPANLVATAQAQGVNYFLNVAVDLHHFSELLATAKHLDHVFTSVGIHPNTPIDETEPTAQVLCDLANNPNIIAIGETGLDYYRSQGDLTWQQQRFRTHIRAAKEIHKPLIIHSREAARDTLRILQEEQANIVGGIMHCFVDDWEIAQQAMSMGFYISFSGIVTFKNAHILQDVAKKVPLSRLLVETDSPYLAPVPHRGKTNQPAYLPHIVEFIAHLRQESVNTITQVTTENFFQLFNKCVTQEK
jgi:TatD DNase family protein